MSYHDLHLAFHGLARGDETLFAGLVAATRPVEDITISEWADRHRVVSDESGSPWPGPFRTERIPYLREPQDCLHPDHPARRVTARWAAQMGKSTAIENWFGFIVDRAPGSMMITLPTLEEAVKFNRIKLQPTIEASPRISHKVLPVNSRDEQGSTTFFKRFPGGFCQIVNAGSSKGLQMVSIKYLAMDEVTGYPRDVDGRGSPRDQARARQKMYGDMAKEWQGSTPGIIGECVISQDFDAGDRRHFYMPCPHCSAFHPLQFDNMRGPDEAAGLGAHFRCPGCDSAILDGHKGDMLAAGIWIPTRTQDGETSVPAIIRHEEIDTWRCNPCEGRCRDWQPSYQGWAAMAPRERFGDIWERWVEAQGNSTKLRVFSQQDLGLPYDPGGAAIEWEKILQAARECQAKPREVPRNAGFLVSAADVQGYGIKWAVYAIGPRGQRWLIDRALFEGPPDQSDEPWIALADALGRTYETGGSEPKRIDLSGVDSGFATRRVYRFCNSRPNCFALDGRHTQSASWLGTPVVREIKDGMKRVLGRVSLYPVHNYDVKTEVVASLANLVAGPDHAGQWPRNTLHLPGDLTDEDFAQEITAERLVDPDEEVRASVNRRARHLINPRAKREWKRIGGRKNDWFDVTVYAYALGWHLETKHKMTAARWADLIVSVHGQDAPADLFDAAADPFTRKTQPKRVAVSDHAAELNG